MRSKPLSNAIVPDARTPKLLLNYGNASIL
jgi:hypothetical protein